LNDKLKLKTEQYDSITSQEGFEINFTSLLQDFSEMKELVSEQELNNQQNSLLHSGL